MKKAKWYWHIHHNMLIEPSTNIEERIVSIKTNKPKDELGVRLRLLREVRGKLPDDLLKAREAYFKAREAYDKAREAYAPQIEALHAKECPNCPWDGMTIFPSE